MHCAEKAEEKRSAICEEEHRVSHAPVLFPSFAGKLENGPCPSVSMLPVEDCPEYAIISTGMGRNMFMEDRYRLDPGAERRHVKQSQKAWKFISDANHLSMADLNRTAVEDGVRKYS